jgi:hypothetical protein
MARLSIAFALLAVVLFSPHAWAQVRSNAASVTLLARMEESFSMRFVEAPSGQPFAEGGGVPAAAVQVFLHWQLRGGRTFKIAPAIEAENAAQTTKPELVTLSQLAVSSQVFGFLSSPRGPTNVLATWGDSEETPVGTAAILLALPTREDLEAPAYRFSVAIF